VTSEKGARRLEFPSSVINELAPVGKLSYAVVGIVEGMLQIIFS
jgi:hypothetical protein